jgi:hypothetical protein
MILSVLQNWMPCLICDHAPSAVHQAISVQANRRAAPVRKSAAAFFGRSQNDFIRAAKLDALFDL